MVVSIGTVPWTRQEMIQAIPEFLKIYNKRPIRNNEGGMRSPHLFPTWFLIKKLKPKYIIESGVWKGQGTYFIEQAAPKATIFCLDPNLSRLVYKSKRSVYSTLDFSKQDWSSLPKDQTLVFFDDHQDALKRVRTCQKMGFKHLMFEDNYPPREGDTYSLKKAFMHSGHKPLLNLHSTKGLLLKLVTLKTYITQTLDGSFVPENAKDDSYLRRVLKTYYEFPPIIKLKKTRWGSLWTNDRFPTPKPLFPLSKEGLGIFKDEAQHYTWICYAKLK